MITNNSLQSLKQQTKYQAQQIKQREELRQAITSKFI